MGRPSTYNDEIADDICERLAGGESLNSFCGEPPFPPQSVVFQWLSARPEFAEKYARARQFWAESEFEKMMQIADTPQIGEKRKQLPDGKVEIITGDMTEHRKLQVDTRKWALARMSPKKYGDKTQHVGEGGGPLKIVVTGLNLGRSSGPSTT